MNVASLPSSRISPLFVVRVIVAAVPLPTALTFATVILPTPVVTILTSSFALAPALAALVIVTALASLILISPVVALSTSRLTTDVSIASPSPTPVVASAVNTCAVIFSTPALPSVIAPVPAFKVTSPAVAPAFTTPNAIPTPVRLMSLASASVLDTTSVAVSNPLAVIVIAPFAVSTSVKVIAFVSVMTMSPAVVELASRLVIVVSISSSAAPPISSCAVSVSTSPTISTPASPAPISLILPAVAVMIMSSVPPSPITPSVISPASAVALMSSSASTEVSTIPPVVVLNVTSVPAPLAFTSVAVNKSPALTVILPLTVSTSVRVIAFVSVMTMSPAVVELASRLAIVVSMSSSAAPPISSCAVSVSTSPTISTPASPAPISLILPAVAVMIMSSVPPSPITPSVISPASAVALMSSSASTEVSTIPPVVVLNVTSVPA